MWKTVKLVDLCRTLHQGLNTAGEKIAFVEDGFPIIQTRNISEKGIDITSKLKYLSTSDWEKYRKKYKPEVGDVFFTNIGTIGKTAIVTEEMDYLIHWNIFKIRPDSKLCTPEFLKTYLDYLTAQKYFQNLQKGGTVNFVTKKMISEVIINLPPLAEQQRIVAKLDAAFAEINTAIEAANAKETEIEKLGRFALETYFKENFRTKKIGDLGGVKSGGTPKSTEQSYWNGEIEWYSSGELNDMYASPTVKRITNEGLNSSNAKIFPKGTLLVGIYDTAAMKMSILQNEATFNQAIVGIPPNEYAFPQYLFYALNYLKPKILLERRGVRQQNLSLAKIKNVDVPIPSKEQQQCIVNQANTLTQKIEFIRQTLADKKTHLANLKASILAQELQSEAA